MALQSREILQILECWGHKIAPPPASIKTPVKFPDFAILQDRTHKHGYFYQFRGAVFSSINRFSLYDQYQKLKKNRPRVYKRRGKFVLCRKKSTKSQRN